MRRMFQRRLNVPGLGHEVGPPTPGSLPWSLTDAESAGETLTKASQLPGEVSNHETFRNAHILNGGGYQYDLYPDGIAPRYLTAGKKRRASFESAQRNSTTSADSWDGRCG